MIFIATTSDWSLPSSSTANSDAAAPKIIFALSSACLRVRRDPSSTPCRLEPPLGLRTTARASIHRIEHRYIAIDLFMVSISIDQLRSIYRCDGSIDVIRNDTSHRYIAIDLFILSKGIGINRSIAIYSSMRYIDWCDMKWNYDAI